MSHNLFFNGELSLIRPGLQGYNKAFITTNVLYLVPFEPIPTKSNQQPKQQQ